MVAVDEEVEVGLHVVPAEQLAERIAAAGGTRQRVNGTDRGRRPTETNECVGWGTSC